MTKYIIETKIEDTKQTSVYEDNLEAAKGIIKALNDHLPFENTFDYDKYTDKDTLIDSWREYYENLGHFGDNISLISDDIAETKFILKYIEKSMNYNIDNTIDYIGMDYGKFTDPYELYYAWEKYFLEVGLLPKGHEDNIVIYEDINKPDEERGFIGDISFEYNDDNNLVITETIYDDRFIYIIKKEK